ncbi:hypothetical protein CEXT_764571 [Caerostris extrusa]|uniref:Uncharacterized protein n=1 Tax=Caerostris extrusa TaxID=172846 RepID=A0AAV4MVS8_CAEEX|nr:hypothetical protein CEXT_764571 [Caerostris extrusa]
MKCQIGCSDLKWGKESISQTFAPSRKIQGLVKSTSVEGGGSFPVMRLFTRIESGIQAENGGKRVNLLLDFISCRLTSNLGVKQ